MEGERLFQFLPVQRTQKEEQTLCCLRRGQRFGNYFQEKCTKGSAILAWMLGDWGTCLLSAGAFSLIGDNQDVPKDQLPPLILRTHNLRW